MVQVYDVDIAVVTNTEGVILFRGHDPNKSGDLVAHRRDTATALSGKELTYWSGGSSTTLGYYHTRPLVLDGRIVGTVLAAKSAYVYE